MVTIAEHSNLFSFVILAVTIVDAEVPADFFLCVFAPLRETVLTVSNVE